MTRLETHGQEYCKAIHRKISYEVIYFISYIVHFQFLEDIRRRSSLLMHLRRKPLKGMLKFSTKQEYFCMTYNILPE